ncbi:MAG: hypothetical protein CMC88_09030 [Flavobacteriaceae bacterium]|nr:hypothetical protein [Flavobacteriaceae bacterium]
MKKVIKLLLFSVLSLQMVVAQKTITGVVSDNEGLPLPGATILVEGTSTGVTTDFDGNFSITAEEGDTLNISYVGYQSQSIVVGDQDTLNISLELGNELEEVVVTSLGIKREAKALGYAVQSVSTEDITDSGANSAIDAMVGKVAGVQITRSSGSVGGGSRIIVRGVTSMIGNNQALIVIDGVRSNNESLNSGSSTSGTSVSNRLMDLNNEDIASINVLKGAAATSLYGTSGSNGVIVITTKKGQASKMNVNFSTEVSSSEITSMIDLQSIYAQGSRGKYRDPSTGNSGSWGPRMTDLEYQTGQANVPSTIDVRSSAFDSDGNYLFDKNGYLVPKGSGNGRPAIVFDNVNPFFQTAMGYKNNISIDGGTELATYRFSASALKAEGVIPKEDYNRKTFNLSSTLNPSDKLSITTTLNYIRSENTRIQQGSNTSGLLLGMLRTPVSFDNTNGLGPEAAVNDPSSYIFASGRQRNYRGGGGYDNPYWIINNALRFENANRTFGSFQLTYNQNEWFNIGLNVGADFTSDIRKQNFEIGSRTSSTGRIDKDEFTSFLTDAIFTISGGSDITDQLSVNYLVGANASTYERTYLYGQAKNLVFQGFLDLSNGTTQSAGEDFSAYNQFGMVAQVEASYADTFYLTASARQDYDSRLGVPTREFKSSDYQFLYPSLSASVIFSEIIGNNDLLSFGKFRASWAQVGAPPPGPYYTSSSYETSSIGDGWGDNISFPIAGVTGFEIDNILGAELKPELSEEIEVGVDLRFLQNKVGLDLAYWQRKSTDAILNASLPPSTGYISAWLNAGQMTSKGIEATLNLNLLDTDDYGWNSQINYTTNESIVDELAPGLERLFLAGFSTAGTYLVAGNQYGAIFGGAYLRAGNGGPTDDKLNIPEGEVVINDDPASREYGYQAVDPSQRAIGDPNPDFILGWNNSFRIKDVKLGFLLDWREGGDLWNGTAWALSFFGRSQLTADTREEAPTPISGVLKSNGQPNTIPVTRDQSYWTSSLGGFGAVGEQFVQDGGWLRLREVSLSYKLPLDLLGVNFINSADISVLGRNLWYQSDYDGIDPETSLTGTGNGQGFDYFNMPSTSSIIFKLNLNF